MAVVELRGKVRARNPESSWNAAALQTVSKVGLVKSIITKLLEEHGDMTDEVLVDRFDEYTRQHPGIPNVTPQNVRTRRHELHYTGAVRDTGRREPTRAGSTATVWTLVIDDAAAS